MHQGMELPPAVVVGVEEEGFREEEQDVREEGGREHAHQVVRELRIQDDEHERQGRAEGRGERERDGEELRELVREPVVSQISGLVADRLDDEREDGDGKDEGREQQVELRDHPDGDAAADDAETSGTPPPRRACPGPVWPPRPPRRPVPRRGASRRRSRQEPGSVPVLALHQRRRHPHRPGEHHERGDETEKDQQFAVHHVFIRVPLIGDPQTRAGACGCTGRAEQDGSRGLGTAGTSSTRRPRLRGSRPRTPATTGACSTGQKVQPDGEGSGALEDSCPGLESAMELDATSSPLHSNFGAGTIENRGLRPRSYSRTRTRVKRAIALVCLAGRLTARVTGRMKIASAIQHDSVLSSLDLPARRFSVSGRESTGGHSSATSRRAHVPSGEVQAVSSSRPSRTTVVVDHSLRGEPVRFPRRRCIHEPLNRVMAMKAVSTDRRDFIPYPTNRVVGTIADADKARAAIDALLQAGFDREHIDILHGEEDLQRLDPDRRRPWIPRAVSPDVDSHLRTRRVQAPDASRRGCPCGSIRDHGAGETAGPPHHGRRHPAPVRRRVRGVLRPMGVRGTSRHRHTHRRKTSRSCSHGRGTIATPTRSPRCSMRMPNS